MCFFFFLSGLIGVMVLQALSKIRCLKAITWRYIIRYSILLCALVFLAWQVGGSQTVKFHSELYICLINTDCDFIFFMQWEFSWTVGLHFYSLSFCLFSSFMVGFDIWYFCLGLIIQGQLLPAVEFVYLHKDCFFDIALLSTVRKLSLLF